MMITIHGLPPRTNFLTIKALVKQECNITELIIDNVVADGPNSKKVRIGLSDDSEGYRVIKNLDGFRMSPTHVLKLVPVGKPLNPPPQQNYDQRPNYQNAPENDYPNQPRQNYPNQPVNDYGNRQGPQGPPERHPGSHGNYVPSGQRRALHEQPDTRTGPLMPPTVRPDNFQRPMEQGLQNQRPDVRGPMNQGSHNPIHSEQWSSNMGSNNQWGSQHDNFNQGASQPGFVQQQSQNAPDQFGQVRPMDQRFGSDFTPKPQEPAVAPGRRNALRMVEIVDNPPVPARQQDKPITIMKDNFQGPSNFNVGQQQHGHFDKQPVPSPWQQNQLPKAQGYDDRRPPIDKRPDMPKQMSDYDKREHFSPPRNRHSPRGMSPSRDRPLNPGRNYQESGRRVSPPGRSFPPNDRPSVRGFSPSGRRISPAGRRVSPSGRRVSPLGRRVSPSGRRISPMGRRMSPSSRRMSPGRRDDQRRMSPNERRAGRHESGRFSPKRGSPTRRLESPGRTHRFSPSRLGAKPSDKFLDDKAVKAVRPAYEPQAQNQSYTGGYRPNVHETYGRQGADMSPWQSEKIVFSNVKKDENRRDAGRGNVNDKKSPARRSRSPMRRDRSPLKERYRRQTPSPRSSRSPRRSWALEKRSSPELAREPPPPPVWPGQEPEQPRKSRFEEQKRGPVWEGIGRADDERRPFEEKLRVRADLGDKFSARPPVDRDDFRDGRQMRSTRDLDRHDPEFHADRAEFRRESPRRHDEKVGQFGDIEKDFQDIYKRSVELRKKTEERQKSGDRRREEVEERRRDERYSPPSPARDRGDDEWGTKGRTRMFLAPAVKMKRDKAVDEICKKINDKYDLRGEAKIRANEELKMSLYNVFLEMFGDKDVSFIELVVKYNAKYDEKTEEKLMRDVLARLPSHYRTLKRKGKPDTSETEAKSSRRSPPAEARRETSRPKLADAVIPEWNAGFPAPSVVVPMVGMGAMDPGQVVVPPGMYMPQVYPQQFASSFAQQLSNAMSQQAQFSGNVMTQQANYGANAMSQQAHFSMAQQQQQQQFGGPAAQLPPYPAERTSQRPQPTEANDCHNLYLCQDDFEPFTSVQASYLREFIVSQIVRATETAVGWSPDVTIKGLQSVLRYELTTRDDRTKDWILHLDFSEFEYFNVLVYTKEELWYERAAIWLPGHSRSRNLEPLDKLKLQNAHLDGVDLTKWKFVKKVVAAKGTRLYVDMPPSSARGLERHDMTLSYELQKVNVFLKAVAVDKDAFDAGLRETSITDPSLLVAAVQTSPMPTLNANAEPDVVKIGIHSQKTITLDQARKIKEVVVYFLFKHLQSGGGGRTDFVKYGFLPPTYLGVVPENAESKRWLTSRNFGKMNRHNIVVFGEEARNIKYFKMSAHVPHEYHGSTALILERLKQSNQGVKGLHFNLWKPLTVRNERKLAVLTINVDMDSVETLSRLKFRLDYVGEYGIQSVHILSEYSTSKLMEKIRKFKMEQVDSYDVANMDIDSDSNSDVVLREGDDEVVFLD